MSQQEIMDLFKKKNDWLSTEEIAKKLKKSSKGSIGRAVLVLFKSNDLEREERRKTIYNHKYYVYKLK
jgi:predicted transcriptional regulator